MHRHARVLVILEGTMMIFTKGKQSKSNRVNIFMFFISFYDVFGAVERISNVAKSHTLYVC